MLSDEIWANAAQLYEKSHLKHLQCHFLLAVCTNNRSIWHQFRDITTFTEYVIGCDLEKYFVF